MSTLAVGASVTTVVPPADRRGSSRAVPTALDNSSPGEPGSVRRAGPGGWPSQRTFAVLVLLGMGVGQALVLTGSLGFLSWTSLTGSAVLVALTLLWFACSLLLPGAPRRRRRSDVDIQGPLASAYAEAFAPAAPRTPTFSGRSARRSAPSRTGSTAAPLGGGA